MKRNKIILFIVVVCVTLIMTMMDSNVSSVTASGNKLDDENRVDLIEDIEFYVEHIAGPNELSPDQIKQIDDMLKACIRTIGTSEYDGELIPYIADVKAKMDIIASGAMGTVSNYLFLTDNVDISVARYGQQCKVMLSVINLEETSLTNLIITPKVSTAVTEWPFQIKTSGYTRVIPDIPGNTNYDDAIANRREVTFDFVTRDDVYSGYYKLEFDVAFTRGTSTETTTLSTYVKGVGAKGSGTLDGSSESGKSSKPRIIVKGFETTPEQVYAGDVFTVDIHIENTSQRTAVSNMQIDLKATPEGDESNQYEAFLPTSGSNTVYIDTIKEGGVADISIEMTAKADLAQKPYVLNVNMEYEDDQYNTYQSQASISIPIKQESKFDVSTPEVMPSSINVGSQANVMYSIYNTGKTTLYNVQARFEAESITGGEVFVGKIDPGATGNVDAMITGVMPTMDDGSVKAIVSYEDEAGNESIHEEIINIFVMEEFVGPAIGEEGYIDPMYPPMEESGGFPVWVIIIIVVVVIAGLVVGVILVTKKIKKKKLNDELAELDEELEDDDIV